MRTFRLLKTRAKLVRMIIGLFSCSLGFFRTAGPAFAQDYHWLYESNFAETAELRLVDFQIVGATAVNADTSILRLTAAFTNSESGVLTKPQALLTNVPTGFEMPTNITDRLLFAPDTAAYERVQASNDIAITVFQPLAAATNALMSNASSFAWSIGAVERPCLASNTLVLDSSFSNSLIQVSFGDGITWISNPPPQISLIASGWLVIPGEDYPINTLPAPYPFEVESILHDASLGTGLVAKPNALNWLKWLCSARLRVFPQGFDMKPEPRDFTVPGTYIPPGTNAPNTTSYVPVGGLPESNGDLPQQAPFGFLNGVKLTNGVNASASLGLGAFKLAPEITVREFKVKKIKLTVTAHPYATFRLRAAAGIVFDRKEHEILRYTFPLPSIAVGPFDVELEMPCRLYFGGEGSLSDHAELTLSQQSEFQGVFELDGGDGTVTTSFTPQPLDFTPPATDKQYAGGRQNLRGHRSGRNGRGEKLAHSHRKPHRHGVSGALRPVAGSRR